MVCAYRLLQAHLAITKIKVGIGGSTGGQQLMEWAVQDPDLFEYIFPIATNAVHSPWGKAFNASQRLAIEADATWANEADDAGKKALKWPEVSRCYRTERIWRITKRSRKPAMI